MNRFMSAQRCKNMKFLQICILTACMVGALSSQLFLHDPGNEWEAWKAKHGKKYSSGEEEARRRTIWKDNLDMVLKHNLEFELGLHSYTLGMNKFGDLKQSEYLGLFTGRGGSGPLKGGSRFLPSDNTRVPPSLDWREKGYVTPVKDQADCGSCWAFSATGSLEGQHFKKTRKLVSLSEQNLVDCSWEQGNTGCYGGLMTNAFEYVILNDGIDTEESYPYVGEDQECKFNRSNVGASCKAFRRTGFGNETILQMAVAEVGPISVSVDPRGLAHYKSGIYDDPSCEHYTMGQHALLVVGYGHSSSKGKDYWIVKNSWGKDWGMDGYVYMVRNKGNQCGIADDASFPLM